MQEQASNIKTKSIKYENSRDTHKHKDHQFHLLRVLPNHTRGDEKKMKEKITYLTDANPLPQSTGHDAIAEGRLPTAGSTHQDQNDRFATFVISCRICLINYQNDKRTEWQAIDVNIKKIQTKAFHYNLAICRIALQPSCVRSLRPLFVSSRQRTSLAAYWGSNSACYLHL